MAWRDQRPHVEVSPGRSFRSSRNESSAVPFAPASQLAGHVRKARLASPLLGPGAFPPDESGRSVVSDPFYRPPAQQPIFHGRVSTSRGDKGFENYLNLTMGHYRMRIFLDGEEHKEVVTADPNAGTVEIHIGGQTITLSGRVEVRLVRNYSQRTATRWLED